MKKVCLPRVSHVLRKLADNSSGAVMVEFVLTLPVLLVMLGLVVFAGEGYEIKRKVSATANTLTTLAAQQSNLCAGATTTICAMEGVSTTNNYSQILQAASLIMAPYDPSGLSMTLSEIQVTGSSAGTVIWSEATAGASALSPGAATTFSGTMPLNNFIIMGTVTYTYQPLNIGFLAPPIVLTSTVQLIPFTTTSIACCT